MISFVAGMKLVLFIAVMAFICYPLIAYVVA